MFHCTLKPSSFNRAREIAGRIVGSSDGVRYFSVINLSDESAVEKFRTINHKSVLYFTASWCGRKLLELR